MATKLYFHVDSATDLGTSPPTTKRTGLTIDAYMGSAETQNLACDETVGPAQDFAAGSSVSTTATQTLYGQRFFSPSLAAQTIGGSSQTITINVANEQSNNAMNFGTEIRVHVSVWRPSTNTFLGAGSSADYINALSITSGLAEPGAAGSERVNHGTATFTPNSFTVEEGDRLCIEVIWRFTQSMSTSYTGTFYYDGTTENTTTNSEVTDHASFIQFSDTITFSSGPTVNSGALSSSTTPTVSMAGASDSISNLNAVVTGFTSWVSEATVTSAFDSTAVAAQTWGGATITIAPATWQSDAIATLTWGGASVVTVNAAFDMAAATSQAWNGVSDAATAWSSQAAATLQATGASTAASLWSTAATASLTWNGETTAASTWDADALASLAWVGAEVAAGLEATDALFVAAASVTFAGDATAASEFDCDAVASLTMVGTDATAPTGLSDIDRDGGRRKRRELNDLEEEDIMLFVTAYTAYVEQSHVNY